MTYVCAPVRAKSYSELSRQARAASKNADMVEIWVDRLPLKLSAEQIMDVCNAPLIIVNKNKKEKGGWNKCEAERIERLKEFVRAGVDFVDIDQSTSSDLIKQLLKAKKTAKSKTSIIVSWHNFKNTPSETVLMQKYRKAVSLGADVVKIATFARQKEDNIKLFELNAKVQKLKKRKPLAFMAMGQKGILSRMAAPLLGSYLCFAALNKNQRSAPGQLTIDDYKKIAQIINNQ